MGIRATRVCGTKNEKRSRVVDVGYGLCFGHRSGDCYKGLSRCLSRGHLQLLRNGILGMMPQTLRGVVARRSVGKKLLNYAVLHTTHTSVPVVPYITRLQNTASYQETRPPPTVCCTSHSSYALHRYVSCGAECARGSPLSPHALPCMSHTLRRN